MGIIVIDPGHGGNKKVGTSSPNNAVGAKGTKEKNVSLEIGKLTAELLSATNTVILTRDKDINLDLKERAKNTIRHKADCFVSIHFNGFPDPQVQGTETWLGTKYIDDSVRLASSIQRSVVAVTGYKDRGLKSKNLGVLNLNYHHATTAVCLVEISFLTDPEEEARLMTAKYKKNLAQAIFSGITEYITKPKNIKKYPVVQVESLGNEKEVDI